LLQCDEERRFYREVISKLANVITDETVCIRNWLDYFRTACRHWKRVGIFISDYFFLLFESRAENLLIPCAILVLTFNDATVNVWCLHSGRYLARRTFNHQDTYYSVTQIDIYSIYIYLQNKLRNLTVFLSSMPDESEQPVRANKKHDSQFSRKYFFLSRRPNVSRASLFVAATYRQWRRRQHLANSQIPFFFPSRHNITKETDSLVSALAAGAVRLRKSKEEEWGASSSSENSANKSETLDLTPLSTQQNRDKLNESPVTRHHQSHLGYQANAAAASQPARETTKRKERPSKRH
jgi:hypothetical protein